MKLMARINNRYTKKKNLRQAKKLKHSKTEGTHNKTIGGKQEQTCTHAKY